MFTTCPNCALNLAVTAADLRIGQGYVRCGRCVSVFNALVSLAEDSEIHPAGLRVEDSASATQSRPVPKILAELQDHAPQRDAAPLPAALASAATAAHPELELAPDDAPEDHLPEVGDDTHDLATGTFETIVLEGDGILQTEEFVDESEIDEQIKALAQQLDVHEARFPDLPAENDRELSLEAAMPRPAPGFLVEESRAGERAAAPAEHEPATAPAEAAQEPSGDWLPAEEAPPSRPSPWVWASAGLALLLGLQAVHHWRAPLARHVPVLGGLYAALGAPVAPAWRLSAYDVRQLGAATDPEDARRIEVRASVHNTAREAQPAPLLRVVLQDRFGNELARRDLAPAQYLRGAPLTMLAADQRIDASLAVDDPEQKAVGFELDACLPTADGRIRCAAEAPTPQP